MILADTMIWIHHFRSADPVLQARLRANEVSTHPLIVAELALGSIPDRLRTLAELEMLPQVVMAQLSEVRHMVEVHGLHAKGIGVVDAHVLASTLMTPRTELWTRDKRLRSIAEGLGVHADLM